MMAAIPMWLIAAGTATSQSTVTNNQVQAGDIFASQTLDVVTNTSDTTAVTTATGNGLTGSVVTGSVDIQSTQSTAGQVGATTTINIANDAGPSLTSTTAATGNTGDAGIEGGGALTGSFVQGATGGPIYGENQINAANAETTDAAQATQAMANSQGFGATGSSVNATVHQSSAVDTTADGGAILGYVGDQGGFSAAAVANNVTSVGVSGSTQTLDVTQSNTGALVRGAQFTNLGNSQDTNTSATATANNFNASNEGGAFNVGVNQSNDAYVRAQGEETSYEFGGATVSAYGVGNSTFAGNSGTSITLNNTQVNGSGGVESVASFTGDNGYDAFVSSTAMGNAATGYACSTCGGVMTVHNSQTNNGDAAAMVNTSITTSARSVRGTATAVGNNASFYVTQPNTP
jgi:hypothetical protein